MVEPPDAASRCTSSVHRHAPRTRPALLRALGLENATDRSRIAGDVAAAPKDRVDGVIEKDELLRERRFGDGDLPGDATGRAVDHEGVSAGRLVRRQRDDGAYPRGRAVAREGGPFPGAARRLDRETLSQGHEH